MTQLSVVIVHYKTLELTKRCLSSIFNNSIQDIEVIVIDNNSQDQACEVLKGSFPNLIWVKNSKNEGFGRACNIGIHKANGNHILLLNSDAIFNRKTALRAIETLNNNKKIGLVGCQIMNEDLTKQNYTSTIACYKYELNKNLIINKVFPNLKCEQNAIMGSFMMLKKDVIRNCGAFDPNFFLYSEEIELCNRILKHGYKIITLEDEFIIHKNNGSINSKDLAFQQSIASKYLLFLKTRGYSGYLLLLIISFTTALTNLVFMFFIDQTYVKDNVKNLKLKIVLIPNILSIPFQYSKKYRPSSKNLLKLKKYNKN